MLSYRNIGKAPAVVHLRRNGHPIIAARTLVGELQVAGGSIQIADTAWVDDVPPLSINVGNGIYPVYVYVWPHRSGPINVYALIVFAPQEWTLPRRLRIINDIRPDLDRGIIVDSAEIAIQSRNTFVLASGLGDGYYPVYENRNLAGQTQSVIVDFNVWKRSNYGVSHGYTLDDYGIPIDV